MTLVKNPHPETSKSLKHTHTEKREREREREREKWLPWQHASHWGDPFSLAPCKAHRYEHTQESRTHAQHHGTNHRGAGYLGGGGWFVSPSPSLADDESYTSQFAP